MKKSCGDSSLRKRSNLLQRRTVPAIERRRYIRLNAVFPVEFKAVGADGKKALSGLIQGFTRNISHGGICIEVNDLDEALADQLADKSAKVSLTMHIPLSAEPIEALATPAWLTRVKETYPNKYLVGVSYDLIDPRGKARIVGYARWLRRKPKLIVGAITILILLVAMAYGHNLRLRGENRALVVQLVQTLERKSQLEGELAKIDEDRIEVEAKLAESGERILVLEAKIAEVERGRKDLLARRKELEVGLAEKAALEDRLRESLEEASRLKTALSEVSEAKEALEQKLATISTGRTLLESELTKIEKEKAGLEELTLEKMYQWLKVHQNRRTGLVTSYEGDPSLQGWAFTYDQSLVAQNFTLFGDHASARKIFDFFKYKAERVHGWFANAYYVTSGQVAEYTVHTGPNIWLAITILHYTSRTGDKGYLDLAEEIGDWIIKLQDQDPEGGIRGGPELSWLSTEHNLDAYALFSMLYEVTKDSKYQRAAEAAIRWIKTHTYTQMGRLYRGKGDATIATDTFAWAICAIGAGRLKEEEMDPDEIMKFAIENCEVTVDYVRPDGGVIKVTGFDFAKSQHIPRGGVISSEWTAQMVVALRVMGGWYGEKGDKEKQTYYNERADFYLNQLKKLTISSPSWTGQGQGCLPYATQAFVDTGHGWRTPKGRQTGSVAATAYGIFAMRGYNPLKLELWGQFSSEEDYSLERRTVPTVQLAEGFVLRP